MPVSKVKNMIIAALLLVNAFFLALVIVNSLQAKKISEQMTRQTSAICSEISVTLSAKLDGSDVKFPSLLVSDSGAERQELARSFLGECTDEGGLTSFASEKGSAYVNTNGEFGILLNGEYDGGSFSLPGIELERDYGTRYIQTVSGLPVFNCTVTPDRTKISGTVAIGVSESGGTEETISAYTAVLRFISLCKSGEFYCTEIIRVDPGYLLTASVTGGSELDPVWRITADTGTVYIDSIGGGVL